MGADYNTMWRAVNKKSSFIVGYKDAGHWREVLREFLVEAREAGVTLLNGQGVFSGDADDAEPLVAADVSADIGGSLASCGR